MKTTLISKLRMLKSSLPFVLGISLLLFSAMAFALAADLPVPDFHDNGQAPAELAGAVLDTAHAKVRKVMEVQHKVTRELMDFEEVLGTAVSVDEAGEPALVIYVYEHGKGAADIVHALPPTLLGVAARVELTDKFRAYADTRAKQTPPIRLGTSGGWRYDFVNGYCCAGTLGSLIQINGVQYILSNYHVLEADIVNGGNGLVAATGNPVIQPGLIDVVCNANQAQSIGTLIKLSSLPFYNVDCAVARVTPGMVRTDGKLLEVGLISSQTTSAFLNQKVKKCGRTTGLTRSVISGLNATVRVPYDNECNGGLAFTKTFTGQVVIANSANKFADGGDSGSLLVEDKDNKPRAVGLIFAGSSSIAVANPINEVLQFLGAKLNGTATMVGY